MEKALKVPRSTIRFHFERLLEDKRIVSLGKASAVKYQIKKASVFKSCYFFLKLSAEVKIQQNLRI